VIISILVLQPYMPIINKGEENPVSGVSDHLNKGGGMRSTLQCAICGMMLIAMGGLAFAKFTTTDDAIGYRKAVMTVIGEHFKRVAAVITGQTPFNAKVLAQQTAVLCMMARLPWEAFLMPGSEDGNTTLKKTAMKEKDDFMSMARRFEALNVQFDEIVRNGDLDGANVQFTEVAQSCKTCHTIYRKL
jgi:cytochrome c556